MQQPTGDRPHAAQRLGGLLAARHDARRSRRRGRRGTWWRCAATSPRPGRSGSAARASRTCCRRRPARRRPARTTRRCRRVRAWGSPASRPRPGRCRGASPRRPRPVAVGRLDAEQTGAEQMVGAAVERAHRDDVPLRRCVAGVREDHRGHRRHARRERDRGLGVLELGERRLEAGDGRVPEPRVDHAARRRAGAAGRHRLVRVAAALDVGQRIGRRQVDRQGVNAQSASRSSRPAWTARVSRSSVSCA